MKNKVVIMLLSILVLISFFSNISFGYSLKGTSLNYLQNPTVVITNPEDGITVSDPTITVEGYDYGEIPLVEYGYTINYPGGGVFSEFWNLDPPAEYYEFLIDVTLVEGVDGNEITVYAKDGENNEGEDTVVVIYEPGQDDTEAPIVVIEAPVEDMIYPYPRQILLSGYIYDNVGVKSLGYIHEWPEGSYDTGYMQIPGGPVENYELLFELTVYRGDNKITVYSADEAENEGEGQVNVTVQESCTNRTPIMTDSSGNTTFHSVIVGCDHRDTNSELNGCQKGAELMQSMLQRHPGWHYSRMSLLYNRRATIDAVHNAIEEAKDRAQPGDEFLFYFADHGGNRSVNDSNSDPDEPDSHDEAIFLSDGMVSDDELADWLSGFRDCVTITVKLDCCHAGGFIDGDDDLQNATNADDEPYGPDHINIEPACAANETLSERAYYWNDSNGDGRIDPEELLRPDEVNWTDLDGNGRWNPNFDSLHHWYDFNGNGIKDDGEIISSTNSRIVWLSDFLLGNIIALKNTSSFKNTATTNADRNKDGKTTTKELYEFTIKYLIDWLGQDEDNDGQLNEDGYEFEESNGEIIRLYIDNDGDGNFDEDPAPPSYAFYYNQKPVKPDKPTGEDSGSIDTVHEYSSSSFDPDGDDIFYMWDFGDGASFSWIGPFESNEPCYVEHNWDEKGDYEIRVKSRDRCYSESPWSESLSVSMKKSKEKFLLPTFIRFFERFPLIYRLIIEQLIL